jgi:hypothetical protein
VVLGIACILFKAIAYYIHVMWMSVAQLMGLIVPNILLIIIFYLFLFPFAVLSRMIAKKDPLILKNTSGSTFFKYDKIFTKESLINPL